MDSSSRDDRGGSTARNSVIYSDGTSFGPHGLGIGSSGSMTTTASDNSRTSSGRRDGGSSGRPSRRNEGFRRVRDFDDLRPVIDKTTAAASGAAAISDGKAATAAALATSRRADPAGGFVSPLKALTAYLHHTYHLVNPAFFYELSFNPRRVLTKPSKPVQNEGRDNEESDYILYVNDWLGTEEGHKYLILDILGQGTFGQVVKCQDMTTHEIVAVKVIKNKPAYFNQSMMEVTVLEMLNGNWDPNDEHHILRLKDTFIHAKHLCLVLELLSSNLYELIKQNSFQGLSTSLVRVFTAQLLDALTVLNEARLIHCDLKPENILLKTLQTPSIKWWISARRVTRSRRSTRTSSRASTDHQRCCWVCRTTRPSTCGRWDASPSSCSSACRCSRVRASTTRSAASSRCSVCRRSGCSTTASRRRSSSASTRRIRSKELPSQVARAVFQGTQRAGAAF